MASAGEASHEVFEHTADVGLRVCADTLEGLFAEGGRALCALLVEDPSAVRPVREVAIALEANDTADLFVDWLTEILFALENDGLLLAAFDVRVDGSRLQATGRGEPVDPERHTLGSEVKAVTYHGLRLERTEDGWLAEVVLDI